MSCIRSFFSIVLIFCSVFVISCGDTQQQEPKKPERTKIVVTSINGFEGEKGNTFKVPIPQGKSTVNLSFHVQVENPPEHAFYEISAAGKRTVTHQLDSDEFDIQLPDFKKKKYGIDFRVVQKDDGDRKEIATKEIEVKIH